MKRANTYTAAVLALLLIVGSGCKESYFDINNNPNSATQSPAELVLPSALNATATYMNTSFAFLNLWMGYWNWSGNYSIGQQDKNYQFTTSFNNAIWNTAYTRLKDYNYVETQGKSRNQPYLQAIGKVMKAFHYQILVDTYGNVPYTSALQGLSNAQPAYDNGQAIYESLMVQLDSAQTLIQQGNTRVGNGETSLGIGNNDVMFKGDMGKWARFTNTLKLKMLLRQSEKSDRQAYIQTQLAKLKASTAGFLRAGENASVNPGYINSDNRQSPFYGTFGYGVNGATVENYNLYRANKYAVDFYRTTNDDRIGFFYAPVAGTANFVATNFGTVNPLVNSQTSGLGSGVLVSASQDAVVLSSHEALFLQAEAAQRGWISGSAQTLYESAITESYRNLGVEDDQGTAAQYAQAYYSQAINNVGWTASTNKIQAIITQKWASLNGFSPFEAWSDYRRLGLPAVPISQEPSTTIKQIPVRLLYPQTEYSYNSTNVAAQGTVSQFTSKIFWEN
ncbi:SusD/RagB family nutrient-binding outer membrane lipoprotein [Spirosoma rhododendri]|uniref:SusD/RagB family nutrient-binding outer membrane lipoprotein n=1 Tax=Spirosoma rhododendri TaxID=2728024 RepID=A0A7L5DTX0_9BACT|nr:SusD/RagB family nutrient-binding outer membrane lipoprotein [Spirosoma rhododendri]QJD79010.1 SusD/RagB family nutrient-binding outer membrane lipoprotein [Spirosoma rhododendri]